MRPSSIRRGAWLTAVSALLFLFAGCAGAQEQPAAPTSQAGKILYGGTMVLGGGDGPLEPHSSNTANTFNITSQAYNWLLRPEPGDYSMSRIVGDLAEKWETSPDGKAWTFHLRKGVKWHDGSVFTSEDVRASFDRVLNPPTGFISPRKGQFSPIQRMETPDANTIVFHVDRVWGEILNAMSDAQHPILPAKIIKSDPKFFQDNMMGTGPFKLKSFRIKESAELVRNEDYWDKGKPYLDAIKFIYIPDATQGFAAFRTGQLNGPRGVTPADIRVLRAPDNADKFMVKGLRPVSTQGFINFGLQGKSPFTDLRVRQAVNLALDRKSVDLIDELICTASGDGLMVQDTPWYLADLKNLDFMQGTLEQRRAKAKALLAEAGYANGFATDLKTRESGSYVPVAIWVVDQMSKIGITATLRIQQTPQYYEYLPQGNYDVSFDQFASTFATPDDLMNKYFTPEGGQNYNKYDNPQVTQLLRQQSQTLDQAQRVKLVNQAEKLIWSDLPMVHVCWLHLPQAVPSYLQGFDLGVSHYNRAYYSDIWFDERYKGPRQSTR